MDTKQKALIVPINSRRQIFIQDRRGYKKPDWGFFGGTIEKEETPIKTVIREAKEELQIDVYDNELIDMGVFETVWDGQKIMRYMFLYPTEQTEFSVLEGKGGVWFTLEEAREHLDIGERFDAILEKIEGVLP
ncbi:MAG: NUDIX hydrolase [Parcubacteria group bacterium]